LNFSLADSRT